ncbi:hypothetical protein C5Y96_13080 [Blastopirellula marina]|uniref:Uncharacterized protein n=1 Tax=Blastopirellula marina TaxID=124 RepID=A0A2S8FGI3_9BACT|nr:MULTISPECIES: hypothetical protein [Pirellulaceae]PQO31272.1 hypothetical protein C5Y96_13080 [Blastopirellula marina]RCS51666.1 hypothetical protein DTL36_13090 [Bremerella cremea]
MTDESPFKSPEILDELHDSFDKRSQEIFKLASGLRWLELMCAGYFAGLYAPLAVAMPVLESAERSSQSPQSADTELAFTILIVGWIIASLINGLIVSFVLLKHDFLKGHWWTVVVACMPWFSIIGIFGAARLFQRALRAHGLSFGWIGPSQKAIAEQLRHWDGSQVDPKTLGLKR